MPNSPLRPFPRHKFQSNRATTLMEILIVVSLIALTSLALYNSLSNGLKVWERANQLIVEEDVAILFDKLSQDVNNAFFFSRFPISGKEHRFVFSTMVLVDAPESPFAGQSIIGQVEYDFDTANRQLLRRQAYYGQAVNGEYSRPRALISNVQDVRFRYIYLTQGGELVSERILDFLPSGIEIEIDVDDLHGERTMRTYIDLPVSI